MPTECNPDLFGFAPVGRREVVGSFDGGSITSDAGGLLLRQTDQVIGLSKRLAACFHDRRCQELVEHSVEMLVGQRVFGIARVALPSNLLAGGGVALLVDEFALLIVDIRMPGQTGLEFAQMIKARKKTANVPIIFLTAYYSEDQQIVQGYDTGAVDYLSKPVNPAILRSKVAIFAELYRKQHNLEEVNRVLAAVVESSDDAIISTDFNGIIATFNPGAERLFGYKVEEAVGKPITLLIPADRQHEESENLDRIRHSDRVHHYETERRRKDGIVLPCTAMGWPSVMYMT